MSTKPTVVHLYTQLGSVDQVACRRVGKFFAAHDLKLVTCLTCLKNLLKEKQDESDRKRQEADQAARDRYAVEQRYQEVDRKRNGPVF